VLLVVDAGNTNVVFAVHDGATWRGIWRIATEPQRTSDEYAVWLLTLLSFSGLKPAEIERTVIGTVVPAALYLVSDDAPANAVINAGAGGFERAYVTLTRGIHVAPEDMTVETVAARFAEISDRTGEVVPDTGAAQGAMALGGM